MNKALLRRLQRQAAHHHLGEPLAFIAGPPRPLSRLGILAIIIGLVLVVVLAQLAPFLVALLPLWQVVLVLLGFAAGRNRNSEEERGYMGDRRGRKFRSHPFSGLWTGWTYLTVPVSPRMCPDAFSYTSSTEAIVLLSQFLKRFFRRNTFFSRPCSLEWLHSSSDFLFQPWANPLYA